MAIYVMLTTLTDEGRKAIEEDPDRLKDINKEVEYMGAKIVAQYALLGEYDFVNIIEAPGDADAARFAIHVSGRGMLQTMTMAAIPLDDLIAILKKKPRAFQ